MYKLSFFLLLVSFSSLARNEVSKIIGHQFEQRPSISKLSDLYGEPVQKSENNIEYKWNGQPIIVELKNKKIHKITYSFFKSKHNIGNLSEYLKNYKYIKSNAHISNHIFAKENIIIKFNDNSKKNIKLMQLIW